MSFYQNGILISGVNTLPELTRAQYEALPADKRPEYWVCLDEEYEPSSSGHTIEDNDGTDMPQEDNLQFVGVYTEDDATNGKTKVNIVRPMTKEQYEALTPAQKKGFIRTTDEPDNPLVNYSHHRINLGQNSCPVGISQINTDIPLDAFNICPYISAYTTGGVRQVILTMLKSSSAWIVCANNVSSTAQNVTISVDYLI